MYLWRKHVTNNWLRQHSEALLGRYGRSLALVERPGKRTLVEIASKMRRETTDLQRKFGGKIEKLPADWLRQLAKPVPTRPLRIGSRLVILNAPPKRSPPTRTLVIPAEAAFGTGEHATTDMCLRMLERVTRKRDDGWTLLDAGTGSGILAMAGRCFGARRVVAIDNDRLASSTARRNARVNRLRGIEFVTGDILQQRLAGKFDIIIANLFSEMLIAASPLWSSYLARDGHLILSGILRAQEAGVVHSLLRQGLVVSEIRHRGKWIALLVEPRRQKGS